MQKIANISFIFRAKKEICWSPGVPDVDCPTGKTEEPFGLCCFDGCQNSCEVRCESIIKNVTETKIVDKCFDSTRQECTPTTVKKCEEKCKQVEVMKPTEVKEQVCRDKVIKECRDKTTYVRF